jgi:hypothetical protein
LYLAAAIANGNLFWFKFEALIWSVMTIIVFGKLAERVWPKENTARTGATWIFAMLITLPFWEGNIANAELFFLLPTIATVLCLWKKNSGIRNIAGAGMLIGIAGLFKMPALLEAGVWPLVWLATGEKKWFRNSLVLGAAVLIPLIMSGVYFWRAGALPQYITAAWAQNIPYLSSWTSGGGGSGIYSLKGRAVILIMLLAAVLGLNRRLGRTATIVAVWGLISLFAALLSGRPYPHYLLQAAGATAMAAGLCIWNRLEERWTGAGMMGLILASFVLFKFYTYPISGYYLNFANWAWGGKSQEQYYAWFNPQVNNDYEIANIITADTNEDDKIFIWGDEPSLYALSRRLPVGKYTAEYHIKDFKAQGETMKALTANPPAYIITFEKPAELPGLEALLTNRYQKEKQVGNATVYRFSGSNPVRL